MKTDSAEFYSITNLVDYAGQQTQRGLASHGVRATRTALVWFYSTGVVLFRPQYVQSVIVISSPEY